MRLLNIGFNNTVSVDKIVSIINPETSTGKRIRDFARESDTLIDCTVGRKTRSMILTESKYVFLSCLSPEALLQRIDGKRGESTN